MATVASIGQATSIRIPCDSTSICLLLIGSVEAVSSSRWKAGFTRLVVTMGTWPLWYFSCSSVFGFTVRKEVHMFAMVHPHVEWSHLSLALHPLLHTVYGMVR